MTEISSHPKIRVFTTPTCPYCFALKEFLKSKQVAFEEIDVSENKEWVDYLIEKTGKMEVPVIEIDSQFVVGFDKEQINKFLKIK